MILLNRCIFADSGLESTTFARGRRLFTSYLASSSHSISFGSLSKHDIHDSEDVIWNCNFVFLQSFPRYSVICFRGRKTKLNICNHMLTSSTQRQNRSFHVEQEIENVCKMSKKEKCTSKACKTIVFHYQIYTFITFLLPSTSLSWLLKLPITPLQRTNTLDMRSISGCFCSCAVWTSVLWHNGACPSIIFWNGWRGTQTLYGYCIVIRLQQSIRCCSSLHPFWQAKWNRH